MIISYNIKSEIKHIYDSLIGEVDISFKNYKREIWTRNEKKIFMKKSFLYNAVLLSFQRKKSNIIRLHPRFSSVSIFRETKHVNTKLYHM